MGEPQWAVTVAIPARLSNRARNSLFTVATILAVGFTLAGCGETHQDAPDPTAANTRPGTHQAVIQEPVGFRNVAFSCNGTTGVYVTSRGVSTDVITSGIAVLANDPACQP